MVLLAMALGGSVQAMPSGGTIRSGNRVHCRTGTDDDGPTK